MTDPHPLFDPESLTPYTGEKDPDGRPGVPPGRNQAFYHGSNQTLDDFVTSPASRGRISRTGGQDHVSWFTSDPRSAKYHGKHVYQVEPTGAFTTNYDAPADFQSYQSAHPLRILNKEQF